jgi:DNA-directed RNA polymerase III subunit RPC7
MHPPIADAPTHTERTIVAHYRQLRARIHDGPFYAILDSNARVHRSGRKSPPQSHYDPFEGMPTYSQRFTRKRNTLPRLSTRPFVKAFFPDELWAVIDPAGETIPSGIVGETRRKMLSLSTRTRLDKFDVNALDEDDEDGADDADVDKVDGADGDDDKDDQDADQFDEEDEDDNDDYNAEQYFDGGDDDDDGGGGGGGDDDDY